MKDAEIFALKHNEKPATYRMTGPERATLPEAEDDLTLWKLLDLSPEEKIDALLPEEIETAIGNLRKLLADREGQGLSIRAGRTAHRGPDGTRKGRMYIVIKVEDGEP